MNHPDPRRLPAARCSLALVAAFFLLPVAVAQDDATDYPLLFQVDLTGGQGPARASITVSQKRRLLREANFRAPEKTYSDFTGDGKITRDGDRIIWRVPKTGGTLRYKVRIDNRRKSGAYDALVEEDWALFRFDDIFPAARATHSPGAKSISTVVMDVPKHWAIETPYLEEVLGTYRVDNPDRRFDRPTGWVVTGRLGVRKDMISGVEVSVAGPVDMGIQRITALALLRWTLPALLNEIDRPAPARINIVSAADPMWRGGLSAPNSLYLHADLPLLSEDGSSTLLHEIAHVLMPIPTTRDNDWIDEGLAEYLTLLTLQTTGTLSQARFDAAIERFRRIGADADNMKTETTSSLINARAVAIFYDLDQEIRATTNDRADLFALMRQLMSQPQPVDLKRLRELAQTMTRQSEIRSLSPVRVPGFD